jgi:predicted nucleic acid-binding protein
MILLDSDVMIDLLRQFPPAMAWFDTLAQVFQFLANKK